MSDVGLGCETLRRVPTHTVQDGHLLGALKDCDFFGEVARLLFWFRRLVFQLLFSQVLFELVPGQEAHLSKLMQTTLLSNLDVVSLLRLLFAADALTLSELFLLFSQLLAEMRTKVTH